MKRWLSVETNPEHRFDPLPDNPKVAAIADRLITAIAAGDFLPGSRLPSERTLADSLAVGRNTVRSALKELTERGIVETRRGRSGGTFVLSASSEVSREAVTRVFGTDLEQLEETVDAIALGYSLAAEAATIRRTEGDLRTISRALDEFRTAVAAQDPQSAQAADGRFHHAIIDATRQPILHEVIRDLDRKISLGAPLHIWGNDEQHEQMQVRALKDHIEIYEAIRNGDRQAAFDCSYSHAKIDLDIILELLHNH